MTLAPQDIDVQDIDVMARPIQGIFGENRVTENALSLCL